MKQEDKTQEDLLNEIFQAAKEVRNLRRFLNPSYTPGVALNDHATYVMLAFKNWLEIP
jgi:hypothetical protein